MRKRYRPGCLWSAHGVWYIRFGKQLAIRLGTTKELPTKQKVQQAAQPHIFAANRDDSVAPVTMEKVITRYKLEAMSKRASTAATETSWINNYIEPKWGKTPLSEFGHPPEAILAWLKSLPLGTKSKREIKGILGRMVDCAEVWGWITNAPDLAKCRLKKEKGEKIVKARVLPIGEFRRLSENLEEPFRTMASIAYFNGLRVSELFGLRWENIDWLRKQIEIRTSVVNQIADDTKTPASEATQPLDDAEIEMLKEWRKASEFTKPKQYVFSSPFQAGTLPYSYTGFKQILWRACEKAGIDRITPHSFRHSFRAWLRGKGASAEITTAMMRHTKYDQSRQYGAHDGTVTPAVRELHSTLVREAVSR